MPRAPGPACPSKKCGARCRAAAPRPPVPPPKRGPNGKPSFFLSFSRRDGKRSGGRNPRHARSASDGKGDLEVPTRAKTPAHAVSSHSDLNETQRHATRRTAEERRCAPRVPTWRSSAKGADSKPATPGLPPPKKFPPTHHAARSWLAYRHKVSPRFGPPQPSPARRRAPRRRTRSRCYRSQH